VALTRLFVDLNSYFASVEQQEHPELRGRPVAVVPVMTDSTCCIAASYEAKAFGVRTGTRVGDARQMCPELVLVHGKHGQYVRYHHEILAAAESVLPVDAVHSIDEFSCRLRGPDQPRDVAVALAKSIKAAIASRVGECMRCSIGIAPNRILAKIASDMQKPNGLVVLESEELPQSLYSLDLTDLPGVGAKMNSRLRSRGVHSIEQLCALDEYELEKAWGSVIGRYWYRYLRGLETEEAATVRRSIGHQHVLAPSLRNAESSRAVTIRLLHKAAARARHLGYWAKRLTLHVKYVDGRSFHDDATFHETNDTLSLVQVLTKLWTKLPGGQPLRVGVTLEDLAGSASATLPLFPEDHKRERLSRTMDAINQKMGRDAVYLGVTQQVRDEAPTRIAFNHIPDLNLPETSDTEDSPGAERLKPKRSTGRLSRD